MLKRWGGGWGGGVCVNILGTVSKQRVLCDQLSLTQFIQGFSRNILDKPDNDIREYMLWYLSELI